MSISKLMELMEAVVKIEYETPASATINIGRDKSVLIRLYGIENLRKRTPDMVFAIMRTDPRGDERLEEIISKVKAWRQMVEDSMKDMELQ